MTYNADYVAVRDALRFVYGKGKRVDSCAKYITEELPGWLAGPDPARELHLFIWNWFPGGGTAQIAANEVMATVNNDRRETLSSVAAVEAMDRAMKALLLEVPSQVWWSLNERWQACRALLTDGYGAEDD